MPSGPEEPKDPQPQHLETLVDLSEATHYSNRAAYVYQQMTLGFLTEAVGRIEAMTGWLTAQVTSPTESQPVPPQKTRRRRSPKPKT